MHPRIAGRQITRVGVNATPEFGQAARFHRYASADSETGAIDLDTQPVAMRQVIAQDSGRTIVRGDQDVDAAVIIDVAERGSAAYRTLCEDWTGIAAHVDEAPWSGGIADQEVALEKRIWLAALFFTKSDGAVRQKQIQPAIVVEIEPAGAESGVGECDGVNAGLQRHIPKPSPAFISKQARPFPPH